MKKYAKLIIALGLAGGIMLTGCQKNESDSAEPTATPEPTEEATEEATDDSASDQEAALKSELEKLADNARYSDTYRHLQQIEKLKEEADITEYNDALTGLLDDWKKQYIKYKS